jgi:quercetin dioxygenase-like cupin family protein
MSIPDLSASARLVPPGGGETIAFPWGRLSWLCTGERIPDARQTFGVAEILPGCKNPRHYHPNCDEVLYLLEGEIDHTLGDEVHRLTAGAMLHIPANVRHDARNVGAVPARMVIAYDAPDRQAVFLEEGGDY